MLEIEGIINSIIYRNEENGYTVARFETEDGEITVVGPLPATEINKNFVLCGEIVYHERYGEQFKVETARISMPKTKTGIIKYLSSGLIPHIGKITAKKIVNHLGENAIEIIEEDPYKLLEIKGIGKKRIKKIAESLASQKNSREIILFLQEMGFTIGQATRIYMRYQEDTIEEVTRDPYRLIEDIRGIGFLIADRIAIQNGVAPDSEFRIYSAIKYTLGQASINNGDCFLYTDDLVVRTSEMLGIPSESVQRVMLLKIMDGSLVKDSINGRELIYYEALYNAEDLVATRLIQSIHLKKNEAFELKDIQVDHKLELDIKQKSAVEEVFKNKVTVITGGPGTGKTTIIKSVVDIASAIENKVVLCAPTGRAAKRLEESTGIPASTIHRLLKYTKQDDGYLTFEHDRNNPISGDIIIVDEASMMDIEITARLVDAIPVSSSIVFVGDIDQLPSVGPGNVLRDIIESGYAKTITLDTIYRQDEDSNIVTNAHLINTGLFPKVNEKGKDFFFIRTGSMKHTADTIVDLVKRRLPGFYGYNSVEDIQVLSVMKRSLVGTEELNRYLQSALNPETDKKEIEFKDEVYRVGDKIMQSVNNYSMEYTDEYGIKQEGVFNGDMGLITDIDAETGTLVIRFDDGRISKYEKTNIDELMLSYAITIHKSQGSEFKAVVIPIMPGPYMLMTRNLIYTAITRAKELVVLVGDEQVLKRMIDNNTIAERNSSLAYRMKVKAELFGEI
ncbi:SF1B family DNA helicase RecD2 [Microaceticoccus formicicus]|uniref:SF1B family DNA helicase RecD2 n=1 Tax=Microaceticoccus formicicus TaxID=3118105 RepID=UPI003CD02644|nr:ATP-dependent RecD-like DNA helicase [Peptoniphilaceae bacterium AMB_02]